MKQSEALKEVRENLIKKLGENEVYLIEDFDGYGAIQTVKFLDSFILELEKQEKVKQEEKENTCITK